MVKIEITACTNGWLVQAHSEEEGGKVKTDTYACETQQSVAKRVSQLVPKLDRAE